MMTWLAFDFVFSQLSKFGMPWVRAFSGRIRDDSPYLAKWLLNPLLQDFVAALITLVGLYVLGWMVNRVIGRRIIGAFESALNRLPLVQTVYGSTKKLISALQKKPSSIQRVVLIAFPSPDMKVVGFVTRTLVDKNSGEELAAVYVPTTPNPTSGYLEIVPIDQLTPTDWTIDEAMSFIISGGAVAPDQVPYNKNMANQKPLSPSKTIKN